VKTAAIDTSGINAMVAQLKVANTRAKGTISGVMPDKLAVSPGFSDVLKASLEHLNDSQQRAQQLGQSFALGDQETDLSEVMIAMQKANIALHAAVQVRNRLVSAYHDIMNMQV
jgi:flagellar hook-basal body complex protein FliE